MKLHKLIFAGLGVAAMALTSCQADMDEPGLVAPEPSLQPNTTIAELKAAMWQDATNYAVALGYKDEATKTPYIIKGRVISSDASGNIYKSMYIQDETAAITLSINQNSLYNYYPCGQEIVLNLSPVDFVYPDENEEGVVEDQDKQLHFYIGKYAGLEQIGGLGIYNNSEQVSFMPFRLFKQGAMLSGNPKTTVDYVNFGQPYPTDGNMYCIRATIADINSCTSPDQIRAMQSQLVELQNVRFQDGGQTTFSTYQETLSRTLTDAAGNTIVVRNSGYASFYNDTLPEGTGNVRGMLGYFNGTWQLTLRSRADVMIGSKGTKADPYTVEEAIALNNSGASGWVTGYIVGALKAGVQTVSSNDDIDWTATDPTDNNLIIAAKADVRDWNQCMVLPLAQGSPARTKGNLADNPGNLGKKIMAYGTYRTETGIPAIAGNDGSANEVQIDGVDLGSGGGGGGTTPGATIYSALGEAETALSSGWTLDNVNMPAGLSYIFQWKEYNGNHYLNASAYAGGTAYEAEAYAVSPVIDLTGYKSVTASFESAAKFQTTLTQLCGFVVREEGASTWTSLKFTFPASGSWTFASSGNIDLSAYAGKKIQVGFKYGSSAAGADTWEIKNLNISGSK